MKEAISANWQKIGGGYKFLNPPDNVGLLHANYDKLLHLLLTFALLCFLSGGLSALQWGPVVAVGVVFVLQWVRVAQNYRHDAEYSVAGDWAANVLGYVLYGAYRLLL